MTFSLTTRRFVLLLSDLMMKLIGSELLRADWLMVSPWSLMGVLGLDGGQVVKSLRLQLPSLCWIYLLAAEYPPLPQIIPSEHFLLVSPPFLSHLWHRSSVSSSRRHQMKPSRDKPPGGDGLCAGGRVNPRQTPASGAPSARQEQTWSEALQRMTNTEAYTHQIKTTGVGLF